MGYWYGSHWNMMGWGDGGFWPFGMVIWLAVLVTIIALISWAVRAFSSSPKERFSRSMSAPNVLEERYARGEIDRDEYLQKKTDISAR